MTDHTTRRYNDGEVLSGVQRRGRWPPEEKVRIVEETYLPGMSESLVARRHGIGANRRADRGSQSDWHQPSAPAMHNRPPPCLREAQGKQAETSCLSSEITERSSLFVLSYVTLLWE